ncbi:MAG: hypothetical protein KBT20_07095 [Bacteroidales bacterium]|nr:hypothetical protein [Candidatus Liminaster caballi]
MKLNISDSDAANIASFLGYQEEKEKHWFAYKIARFDDFYRNRFEKDHNMQVYFPAKKVERRFRGKTVEMLVSDLYNYVFVLASKEQVVDFHKENDIWPIYRRRERFAVEKKTPWLKTWVTLPAGQMHSIMLTFEKYIEEVEFVTPDDQLLEKGDKVRVIAGHFAGLEGTLITNQGSHKGGRIFVNVTNRMVAKTAYVPDEFIQVLSFSRNTNHFSRQIAAIEKVLDDAVSAIKSGNGMSSEQRASVEFFLFRYEHLTDLSHLALAKFTACRYAALVTVGRKVEAEECMRAFYEKIQSDPKSQRAFERWPSAKEYIDNWKHKLDFS